MTGPQALTRVEQLEAIGAALGRELTFVEQTPDEFAADMAQYGVGPDIVKMLLDYWSDTVDEPDVPRPPDRLIGRPAKTPDRVGRRPPRRLPVGSAETPPNPDRR